MYQKKLNWQLTSWGWAGPSSARLELSLETSSLNWVIVQLISNWDNAHHLWVTWIVLVLVGYRSFEKVKEQFKRGSGQVILLHVQYLFLWNRFLVKLGFIWHTLIMIKECDLVKLIKGILFFLSHKLRLGCVGINGMIGLSVKLKRFSGFVSGPTWQ